MDFISIFQHVKHAIRNAQYVMDQWLCNVVNVQVIICFLVKNVLIHVLQVKLNYKTRRQWSITVPYVLMKIHYATHVP